MVAYKEDFPVGSKVQINDLDRLTEFRQTWKFHNPLTTEQLTYAGQVAVVEKVGYYHGGYVLYQLEGKAGIWHEQCLGPA